MKKRILKYWKTAILSAGIGVMVSGCGQQTMEVTQTSQGTQAGEEIQQAQDSQETQANSENFETWIEEAKGTTVTFYGWGGDEKLNEWIDDSLAVSLKENYDITLERIPMNIDEVLAQLSGEKQAGTETGTIDMIWINGENFNSAKENGMLSGPFTNLLPNMEKYVDTQDAESLNDFCVPIEGYEAPYSKAQLIFIGDSAVTPETPANTQEFLEYCKKYPGKVTYPAPPDFTGSAFVRNIIYDICGYEQFMDMEADKETVKEAIGPALAYLRELNPYLWKQGTTFPASSGQMDTMFQEGELVFNVSYVAFSVGLAIAEGIYPETTVAYQFDKGTIGNTNYIAIAQNAPNKAGAMVAVNEVLSAKQQASKYQIAQYIPVVDYDKLSAPEKELFDRIDTGKGNIPQDELLEKRLPEMPAALVPIIEEIWLEEVVGK